MKELLRVGMTPNQVREACEEWAWQRCGLSADSTAGRAEGIADDSNTAEPVQVVFSRKRARSAAKEQQA